VCECDPHEVPACWREGEEADEAVAQGQPQPRSLPQPRPTLEGDTNNDTLSAVDFGGSSAAGGGVQRGGSGGVAGVGPGTWWTDEEAEEASSERGHASEAQWVNLLRNPEGYTGYAGPSAVRIWKAVYDQNCFHGSVEDMCSEERVFYRLLSGLQTSINTHIAMTYGDGTGSRRDLYTQSSGHGGDAGTPGGTPSASSAPPPPAALILTPGLRPNVDMYVSRIARYPDRLSNLYFAYLFLVRALAKAAPLLHHLPFTTGNATEDAATQALLSHLLSAASPAVLSGFDERGLFMRASAGGDAHASTRGPSAGGACATAAERVNASDLTELLQRSGADAAPQGDDSQSAGQLDRHLRDVWRDKYRNITRIMGAWAEAEGGRGAVCSLSSALRPRGDGRKRGGGGMRAPVSLSATCCSADLQHATLRRFHSAPQLHASAARTHTTHMSRTAVHCIPPPSSNKRVLVLPSTRLWGITGGCRGSQRFHWSALRPCLPLRCRHRACNRQTHAGGCGFVGQLQHGWLTLATCSINMVACAQCASLALVSLLHPRTPPPNEGSRQAGALQRPR
jgi:hypothetical protein